jgi:hypothetical protein
MNQGKLQPIPGKLVLHCLLVRLREMPELTNLVSPERLFLQSGRCVQLGQWRRCSSCEADHFVNLGDPG